jgi:hypothetical protein
VRLISAIAMVARWRFPRYVAIGKKMLENELYLLI